MQNSGRRQLFSGQIRSKGRTHFIDVSETASAERLMFITESRPSQEGFQRSRIMLMAEDADEFTRCFRDALRALKTGQFVTAE